MTQRVDRIVVDGLGRLPQFSHAARIGDSLHVSGTLGTVEGLSLAAGIAAQTTQTLTNIGTILDAAGCTWDDVAKVNVYLHDMADFAGMNKAYGAFFGEVDPPARITVGGADLALGAMVEMDCVAAAPARGPSGPLDARPIARRVERIDHDGETLYFEVLGNLDGGVPPVVLCHGAGGNHAVWFQQTAFLARRRPVIVWDHRGYGHSTDTADRCGPDVGATDLLAILDHLGVGSAHLVGQSMGGWSVVGAALARPDLARSLVLADTPGGFWSEDVEAAMTQGRDDRIGAPDPTIVGRHPAIDPSLAQRDPGRAHLYQQLSESSAVDVPTVAGRLFARRHDRDAARSVTCPVLCIVGERDPLFPVAMIRAVVDMVPTARLVELPGCGHSPYFEDPEAWNLVVGRFLGSIDSASVDNSG